MPTARPSSDAIRHAVSVFAPRPLSLVGALTSQPQGDVSPLEQDLGQDHCANRTGKEN